jgi:hypothetical protein
MKKFFIILKKNWKIALLILGAAFSFFFFKKKDQTFLERLNAVQDTHEKEIKKLNEAREKERRQHEENEARLKETLSGIQAQYESEKKTLDKKKKAEIQATVENHGNDPDELALQLSKVTGFKVILPEKD